MVCVIWTRFLCHFQNGVLHFCTMKTGEVIKQFAIFHSFGMDFAKMALVSIYILQTSKTGSHFFYKEPNYLLKMFLELINMTIVPKLAKKCQILAIFQSLYVDMLLFWQSWGINLLIRAKEDIIPNINLPNF